MTLPQVSIIMPVYNAGEYVVQAVRSVLAQTVDRWELLIVDDGSNDSPQDLLRPYLEDERIRFSRQDNQGVSGARNAGLSRARGEWIAFLDADDALTPRSLECRLALLETQRQLAFIDGRVDTCDATLKSTIASWTPSFVGMPLETLLFRPELCFRCPSWLVRNTGTLRPFKPGMTHGEDLLFFLMNAAGGGYSFVKETVLLYRSGHTSAMKNLRGLEEGYRTLFKEIRMAFPQLSAHQLGTLRSKYVSIMRRSYLKAGNLGSALRVSGRFTSS
jgi:glycosyltransferase involved in cell wall biosynthesis